MGGGDFLLSADRNALLLLTSCEQVVGELLDSVSEVTLQLTSTSESSYKILPGGLISVVPVTRMLPA